MIQSMTGFSAITIVLPPQQINLTMTLKSLNSRFFEFNCKIPFSLTQLETDLIKYFKSRLFRGNLYFTIHMVNPNILISTIEPSSNIIQNYVNAIKKIQSNFQIAGTLSISDMINLPNIFENKEEPVAQETIAAIMSVIEQLTETLIKERLKEGKVLAQDLQNRINAIQGYMLPLEPRAKEVIAQKKDNLFKLLKSSPTAINPETADAYDLAIYHQLEKLDIHEEIVRFKTHLANLETILDSSEVEKGKKIDFTLQELFRETNTIASKCSDAQISSLAIDIKVELEKSREQAQNIV